MWMVDLSNTDIFYLQQFQKEGVSMVQWLIPLQQCNKQVQTPVVLL